MKVDEVKRIIDRGIEIFNRYRSPEAHAELKEVGGNKFIVKFTGPFCLTCGYYDYFEDLLIELEELGLKTKINRVIEGGDSTLVEYVVIE
jgi:hypothetical protein